MGEVFFYALFLFFTLFNSPAAAQQAPQEDERAIREVIDGYYTAWNQHDANKMAEAYALDGDLRTPWNEVGKNRKEVEAIFAAEHIQKMKNAKIEKSIKSIRLIKPNLAFVDVESTITGMQTQDEKQYAPLNHHVVYLMVKRDDKWQILSGRPF